MAVWHEHKGAARRRCPPQPLVAAQGAAAGQQALPRRVARRAAGQKRMGRRAFLRRLAVLFVLGLALGLARPAWHRLNTWLYPCRYTQSVERWAAAYSLDPLLVYAFIYTESGFDPVAESAVGARGLMQITEPTFYWLKSRIAADEPLTFADLYDPDTNIRFGAYYVSLSLARYGGDVGTAAAAYHSGWGTVDSLLRAGQHSADGQTLHTYPYNQMNHYVGKIARYYQKYQALYR